MIVTGGIYLTTPINSQQLGFFSVLFCPLRERRYCRGAMGKGTTLRVIPARTAAGNSVNTEMRYQAQEENYKALYSCRKSCCKSNGSLEPTFNPYNCLLLSWTTIALSANWDWLSISTRVLGNVSGISDSQNSFYGLFLSLEGY